MVSGIERVRLVRRILRVYGNKEVRQVGKSSQSSGYTPVFLFCDINTCLQAYSKESVKVIVYIVY